MKNKMLADRRVVKIDQLKENDNTVPPIGIGIIWDITNISGYVKKMSKIM